MIKTHKKSKSPRITYQDRLSSEYTTSEAAGKSQRMDSDRGNVLADSIRLADLFVLGKCAWISLHGIGKLDYFNLFKSR